MLSQWSFQSSNAFSLSSSRLSHALRRLRLERGLELIVVVADVLVAGRQLGLAPVLRESMRQQPVSRDADCASAVRRSHCVARIRALQRIRHQQPQSALASLHRRMMSVIAQADTPCIRSRGCHARYNRIADSALLTSDPSLCRRLWRRRNNPARLAGSSTSRSGACRQASAR